MIRTLVDVKFAIIAKAISSLLFLTVLTVNASQRLNEVEVKFQLSGKQIHLVGEYTADGYVFNRAGKRHIRMATLDWPPYIGEKLCGKGWVFQLAVAMLVSQGYQVTIQFFPWARAVKEVESGIFDVLFPEYFIEESSPSDVFSGKKRRELLALSSPFPGGDIGFMTSKKQPFDYNGNLNELLGQTIGVVRGYQNTPDFDAMMDGGKFTAVEAVDDLQLMKLLAAGRVNIVIGDPLVLRFSVIQSNLSSLKQQEMLEQVVEVHPMLQNNPLYFAISKSKKDWPLLLLDINEALERLSREQVLTEFRSTEAKICQQK